MSNVGRCTVRTRTAWSRKRSPYRSMRPQRCQEAASALMSPLYTDHRMAIHLPARHQEPLPRTPLGNVLL